MIHPIESPADNYHNVEVTMIGEFEYLLLAAIERLGEDAYGASIRQELEAQAQRKCSIGALYTTLDRLEAKGLIETWMGPATAERGGRSKRMARLTAPGLRAAREFHRAVLRISQGVRWSARCSEG